LTKGEDNPIVRAVTDSDGHPRQNRVLENVSLPVDHSEKELNIDPEIPFLRMSYWLWNILKRR
jgi:hypothetical protein